MLNEGKVINILFHNIMIAFLKDVAENFRDLDILELRRFAFIDELEALLVHLSLATRGGTSRTPRSVLLLQSLRIGC